MTQIPYMQPTPKFPPLCFTDFLQSVFVGVSGLPGDLVRPKWQPNPPKQPDICINWMALGLLKNKADFNAWVGFVIQDDQQVNVTQRMEELEVPCSFYGPQAMEYAALVRDNFQIQANRYALLNAGLGYVSESEMMHVPDLVNERWINRYEMSFYFRRQILRTYPILNFSAFSGTIQAIESGNLRTFDVKVNL